MGEVGVDWADDIVKYLNEEDRLKPLGRGLHTVCQELYPEAKGGKHDGKAFRKVVDQQIPRLNTHTFLLCQKQRS